VKEAKKNLHILFYKDTAFFGVDKFFVFKRTTTLDFEFLTSLL